MRLSIFSVVSTGPMVSMVVPFSAKLRKPSSVHVRSNDWGAPGPHTDVPSFVLPLQLVTGNGVVTTSRTLALVNVSALFGIAP